MLPLPLLWWKSQQKQLREEPVYFCSQSKDAGGCPSQESGAAGHSASAVRKQRETNTAAQLTRFNSAQNPSPWDAAPHNQMGLPTSVNPVLITSHKHTRGLSLGGSRTCPASEAPAGENLIPRIPLRGGKISVIFFWKDGGEWRGRRESALIQGQMSKQERNEWVMVYLSNPPPLL